MKFLKTCQAEYMLPNGLPVDEVKYLLGANAFRCRYIMSCQARLIRILGIREIQLNMRFSDIQDGYNIR